MAALLSLTSSPRWPVFQLSSCIRDAVRVASEFQGRPSFCGRHRLPTFEVLQPLGYLDILTLLVHY